MSPRIGWIEEGDAKGRLAELFESAGAGGASGIKREYGSDILHTMSHLTKHAYRITGEQVQGLRDAGWTEPQIAEAV